MNRKILAITIATAGYALIVFIESNATELVAWLNLIYYLLLIFNTYFSLTFTERAFHVRTAIDGFLNLLLAGLYAALPWVLSETVRFHLGMATFFVLAVIKYSTWLNLEAAAFYLKRKIPINACGALLSLIVLGFTSLAGSDWTFAATLSATLVYSLANVWILWVHPLYRER